jgi:hypothetical protein
LSVILWLQEGEPQRQRQVTVEVPDMPKPGHWATAAAAAKVPQSAVCQRQRLWKMGSVGPKRFDPVSVPAVLFLACGTATRSVQSLRAVLSRAAEALESVQVP